MGREGGMEEEEEGTLYVVCNDIEVSKYLYMVG